MMRDHSDKGPFVGLYGPGHMPPLISAWSPSVLDIQNGEPISEVGMESPDNAVRLMTPTANEGGGRSTGPAAWRAFLLFASWQRPPSLS